MNKENKLNNGEKREQELPSDTKVSAVNSPRLVRGDKVYILEDDVKQSIKEVMNYFDGSTYYRGCKVKQVIVLKAGKWLVE